ncbi:hypothetical protein SGL43_05994 [Streptomyces globisporus]|uniref:Uncharacterized protein n=1 Tax=Streptomyces globisporus TaxID=1908 RepID=A0ABM9H5J5_STRGL|nr:hypothetical protein SGL43_05994 [Streptomyces globisporus]
MPHLPGGRRRARPREVRAQGLAPARPGGESPSPGGVVSAGFGGVPAPPCFGLVAVCKTMNACH